MSEQTVGSVLVYVEPEAAFSHALERAVELTSGGRGSIRLVTVIEPWPAWMFSLGVAKERMQLFLRNITESLQRLANQYPEVRNRIEMKVLEGRPNMEIVRESIQAGCATIMKDAEGTSPETETVRGLDWRLFRKSACPVWLIRSVPNHAGIGVAIAPEEEEEGISFNRKLLTHANDLAKRYSQELHVIQAWDLYGETYLMRTLPVDEYESYMKSYEAKVTDELYRSLEPYGLERGSANVHLVKGAPEEAIAAAANELNLDTLVIGTVARAGLAGHLVGNTAERVIGQLKCGVYAVKPDGWRSPVEV